MKDDSFLDIIKEVDPNYSNDIATTGFIDTGCYTLNALISGSLYGGMPNNRITGFAGEQATGKTYFALTAVKSFLNQNENARVVYFDTEFALDKEFFRKRGIDAERVIIIQPDTLETFRTMSSKILTKYGEQKENERPKLMLVLDSLGNLPSNKEVEDADEGKNVRDMTKTQIIKSIFRILTQKIGKLNVPMIVTNHVYAVIGCLTEGQMVRMNDGSLKDISDIIVGDEVLSENNTVKKVIQTHEYMTEEVYEIEMEDGYVMNCSSNHKFMTKDGWVEASNLTGKEELLSV